MKALPDFRQVSPDYAETFARDFFGDALVLVVAQESDYFRALFRVGYFTLHEGATGPTRSQWSTLKKRMRRVHGGVFVLKETGEVDYDGTSYCYVDFGFLVEGR
ncbi:MAG: hypothetical protein AAF125_18940 [Chloroflexota bacterium]